MKFLVVDDSSVDRHLLVSLLTEMGHSVETCQIPTQVLERVIKGNYDAVFLDIVMPEQDGYKVLRQIRAHQQTTHQRIIIYSSKITPLEINYGIRRAGANDYITKPVTRERLAQVLQ